MRNTVLKVQKKCPQCKNLSLTCLIIKVNQQWTIVFQVKTQTKMLRTYLTKSTPSSHMVDILSEDAKIFNCYEHVPSGREEDPAKMNLMDHIFFNPNSFDNLTLVFRYIGKKCRFEEVRRTR